MNRATPETPAEKKAEQLSRWDLEAGRAVRYHEAVLRVMGHADPLAAAVLAAGLVIASAIDHTGVAAAVDRLGERR